MKTAILLLLTAVVAHATPVLVKAKGDERTVVAKTLLGEARGESRQAMLAVACVIKNRAISRGTSYRAECLRPKQFSCWNPGDPNAAKLHRLFGNCKAFAAAWEIACSMDTLDTSMVNGARHYMTTALYRRNTVSWARTMKPVAVHGCHTFLR
jgi:spore germination cell wall hydrolase CwlJ-like protein